jgi:hypothetical protein
MHDALKRLKKITKNRDESIRLLEAALSKKAFLEYLAEYFNPDELKQEIDFSDFKEKLNEDEFQQMHPKYHYPILWETLEKQGFTAIDATKPIKWLSISYQLLENELIEPYFLAYLENSKNGRNNIIEALRLAKDGKNKKLFDVCRAILRHMFGHIQERGPKAVYQDIPFSVAWWRVYLAKEIQKKTSIEEAILYNYFKNNPTNYNELVMRMSGKLTVIADRNIRDGFFLYVVEKSITKTKEFKEIIAKIGIESTWRSMGSLSPTENKKIIESLVA